MCRKLHPFRNGWHLKDRERGCELSAKFRRKRQILQSCILQQSIAPGLASWWLLGSRAGDAKTWHWKCTITRFGVEIWSESKLTCYERQTTPFLTSWSSVVNQSQCDQLPHWLLGNAVWGRKAAAAQDAVRTPWACSWLTALPCHLRQALPWPHTSDKKMITRLKLLHAEIKYSACSPSWAVFAPFLILAHPQHIACFQATQPQRLETWFKKKIK